MGEASSGEFRGTPPNGVWWILAGPVLITALLGSVSAGTTLYVNLVFYAVIPLSGLLGVLIAWHWWRSFRSKSYMYRDKDGDVVQDEPYIAVIRALILAVLMALGFWWCFQGMLRFFVQFLPSTSVVFEANVTSTGTGKGCRVSVSYMDKFTLGEAHVCVAYAPGIRWIGEPLTVYESVGSLGSKLERVVFEDTERI